ncbi:MAG: hypothetical protein Q4C65_14250 [Eubacteriales bacterium]|nr:hypothetical protein [Eubacteriales bacterium]
MNKYKRLAQSAAVYLLLGLGISALTLALLMGAGRIPEEAIQENLRESADWLREKDRVIGLVNEKDFTSQVPYGFDAVWLGIAYRLDADGPLYAAVNAAYPGYDEEEETIFDGLWRAVAAPDASDAKQDVSYARYWQGMAGVLRVMLVFWNLQELYVVQAAVALLLLALLCFLLIKRREFAFLAAFLAGLWSVSAYAVPFCVFYMPVFLIMAGMMLVVLLKKDAGLFPFFWASGLLTACFDNLSAETLTVSVPLLLALILAWRRGELVKRAQVLRYSVLAGGLWTGGYALAFLLKWGLGYLVLGSSSLDSVKHHAARRIYNNAQQILAQIGQGFWRNLTRLKPFAYTDTYGGLLVTVLLIALAVFCVSYLYGKRDGASVPVCCLILPALIPFARFLVVNNHTADHAFMVYRSLLVTVLAALFFFLDSVEWRCIIKRKAADKSRRAEKGRKKYAKGK